MKESEKTYRVSAYVIPVEIDAQKTLLVHGYTGAIDLASPAIKECLQPGREYAYSEIPLSKETADRLIARGYLTERSLEEEYGYMARFARLFNRCERGSSKVFTWVVAYDCNFRCPYCYEGNISNKGRQWSGKVFTKAMADRAYRAMEEIEPNPDLRAKNITLYGGEPLMAVNREIVEYIVAQGKERGYHFHAVTNGYDLDAYLDLLGEDSISSLQITIDGEKEYHDRRRVHYRNGKSFDRIIENIGKALKTGAKISVRANTDGHNVAGLQHLRQLFTDLGFYQYKTFSFYSALLCGYRSDQDAPSGKARLLTDTADGNRTKQFDYLTREDFLRQHAKNGTLLSTQDYGVFSKIYKALEKGERVQYSTVFCSSQTNAYILDPYGEIYTCWNTVGKKERLLGSYKDGIVWNQKEVDLWHNRNISTVPDCSRCRYALFCGGGCVGKLLDENGDFSSSYCDEYPAMFHVYAKLAYEKFISNKKSINLNF